MMGSSIEKLGLNGKKQNLALLLGHVIASGVVGV